MNRAESSVNSVDESILDVSDLDVDTGGTEQAMQSASSAIEDVQETLEETEQVGESFGDKMSNVFDKVAEKWKEITVVAGGAGIAIEALGGKQKGLTEQTDRVARAMGLSSDELRKSALDITNVTFPIEDVLDLMETGRQQGIKSADQLKEYASFWDTVGDATGLAGPELGKASVGLRAVGISAGNESEALSAFGYITENTTGNVQEFLTFLERTGPQLGELGMDVNDASAMLGILEHEFGMSGKVARSEFRSAVNQADGDLGAMMETLGISESTFQEYSKAVGESSSIIQENADIHAESYTAMDKIKQISSEVMYNYGDLIGVLSSLAPILMGLGPIINGVKIAMGLFNTTLLANPITWVVAGIVALIAIGVLLWKNWDAITENLGKAWDFIKEKATAIFGGLKDFLSEVWDAMKENISEVWNSITESFSILWEGIVNLFHSAVEGIQEFLTGAWTVISDVTEAIWTGIGVIFSTIWEGIVTVVTTYINIVQTVITTVFDVVKTIIETVWTAISTITSNTWNMITNVIKTILNGIKIAFTTVFNVYKNIITTVWNVIKNLTSNVWGSIKSVISSIINTISSTISSTFNSIQTTISNVWNGVKNTTSKVWDGMVNVIKAPVNAIIGIINGMINAINGVKIDLPKVPDWVPLIGGKGGNSIGFNIPNVPQLAKGGLVSDATLALIGEGRDREAVLPLNNNVMGTLADMIVGNMGAQGGQPIDYKLLGKELANALNSTLVPALAGLGMGDVRLIVQKMEMSNDYDVTQLSRELKRLIDKAKRSNGQGWG